MIELQPLTNNPVESKLWLKFSYGQQSRRIQNTVAQWTNNAWSLVLSNRFVYDGWNLRAELNATNNSAIRTYVWGLDLSGSEQGAGGVGGLLSVREESTLHFAAFDGNGNVAGLIAGSVGTVTGRYEYDPFGKTLRATGSMAEQNPLRFSTKYIDAESAFLYYGHRYYNPSAGRWLSRDPIAQPSHRNLEKKAGTNCLTLPQGRDENQKRPSSLQSEPAAAGCASSFRSFSFRSWLGKPGWTRRSASSAPGVT